MVADQPQCVESLLALGVHAHPGVTPTSTGEQSSALIKPCGPDHDASASSLSVGTFDAPLRMHVWPPRRQVTIVRSPRRRTT